MECELCNAKKENHRLIDENNHAFSIIPIEPLKLGHIMILPKKHVVNPSDLSKEELKDFFELSDKLKEVVRKLSNQDPIIIINTGKHKSQEHFHMHILPSKGHLRNLIGTYENIKERVLASKEELEKMKETIISKK